MTKQELLYLKLMEECAEVQQRVSKLMQFGANESQSIAPDMLGGEHPQTNWERLQAEYCDLLAVGYLLKLQGPTHNQIEAKRKRIDQYAEYSKARGYLDE